MIYDLAGFYLFFAISSSTSCARFFSSHSFLHHHFSATLFACYLLQTLCCSTVCVCVLHNISPVWGFLYSCNSSCWSYLSLTVVVFFLVCTTLTRCRVYFFFRSLIVFWCWNSVLAWMWNTEIWDERQLSYYTFDQCIAYVSVVF